MSGHIPEADWRQFKRVREVLLERFCQRVLAELAGETGSQQGTAHQRYLRAYKLLERRDQELARAFNDFRRSTAIIQLAIMRSMGLLTDEELRAFAPETQQMIEGLVSIGGR